MIANSACDGGGVYLASLSSDPDQARLLMDGGAVIEDNMPAAMAAAYTRGARIMVTEGQINRNRAAGTAAGPLAIVPSWPQATGSQ